MSAFDRHPRKTLYEAQALAMRYFDPTSKSYIKRSPQNRRVRSAADLAAAKTYEPFRETRQQRRRGAY
jgi:hypothetical protein